MTDIVTAGKALLAKLDEMMPAIPKRPTIAELEDILAARRRSSAIEITPSGEVRVYPRDEIETFRAALEKVQSE